MASDWVKFSLGEILDITSSKRIFRSDYRESGVPFYRSKEIIEKSKGNDISTELFISEDKFEAIKNKFGAPEAGDILLTSVGTLGIPYLVRNEDHFYFKDGNLTWFRNLSDRIMPKYLHLWFTSALAKRQIDEITIGSTQQALTISSLKSLTLKVPPLPEQKAIAHILGSLDDKIELNRQMNETLEAMAQALFKSWFVDFDPVIDNAIKAGKPIPDELAARAKLRRNIAKKDNPEIQRLFPDEFEFTEELGWIPKGWEVKNSGDLFDVRDGTHDSPKKADEGKYLITSRHITGGIIDYSNAYLISKQDFDEVNKRSKVDSYDILLTMIGTVGISLIVLQEEIDFAIKNVGLFKTGNNRQFAIFFYLYLNSTYMKHYLESMLAGTTQKYLTLKVLRSLPVILSNEEVLDEFAPITSPLFKRIHSNNEQIKALAKLRDTLLPKLMSGEIRVSDAAAMVEDA